MRVFLALILLTIIACIVSTDTKATGAKRDIICATQDYNPSTASNDIRMCRLGLL